MKIAMRAFGSTLLAALLYGQAPPQTTVPAAPAPAAGDSLRPSYVLGTNDQIVIRAFGVEEISNSPFRIDNDGNLTLPILGKVRAGGLSVQQLEESLAELLKKFVRQPQVTVTVVQFRSEPIFLVGAFRAPGIHPLQGKRMLVEMLTSLGGLAPNASRRIKLTRRAESGPIPLPTAVVSPDGKVSTVEISLGSLRESVNPAEDIELMPFDTITVERAEMVYVSGDVGRTGGFELGERDSISVLQLLTMAGGPSPNANLKNARILRPVLNTAQRAEIPLNLKRVYEGKATDYPILPNDMLYIPRSLSRTRMIGRVAQYTLPFLGTFIYLIVR